MNYVTMFTQFAYAVPGQFGGHVATSVGQGFTAGLVQGVQGVPLEPPHQKHKPVRELTAVSTLKIW